MSNFKYGPDGKVPVQLIRDPKFYLENFTKVKTKEEGLAPFKLFNHQLHFFNALAKYNKIIIRKARQMGFSTAAAGWFFHRAVTYPGTNAAIISYDSEQATEILDKIKTFMETLPPELKPSVKNDSSRVLAFDKMNSTIRVIAAKDTAGRGFTMNLVHMSELAFWDRAEEKFAAIMAAVPRSGKVVIESTVSDIGTAYHRLWADEDNGWHKLEYGWWWLYTPEEIEERRRQYNDPVRFAREFLMEFSAVGRVVFDQESIMRARANVLTPGEDKTIGGIRYEPRVVAGGLRQYVKPNSKGSYVMSADVSEGKGLKGDYSAVCVIDRRTGEEVAFWHGKVPPDRLGEMMNDWGRLYNNALVAPEINNQGIATLNALRQKNYPNIYFRPAAYDKSGLSITDRIGWKTTTLTKPLMIADLDKCIRDGSVTFHSKEIYNEAMTYVYDNMGHMNAMDGYNDDAIIAGAIAVQALKLAAPSYDMPNIDYRKHMPDGGY